MGILSESFGLLLGDTTFTDPESGPLSPQNSNLLKYGTPELFVRLYQDFPLDKKLFLARCLSAATFAGKDGDGNPVCDLLATGSPIPFISIAFESRGDFAMAFDTSGLELFRATRNLDMILSKGFTLMILKALSPMRPLSATKPWDWARKIWCETKPNPGSWAESAWASSSR